MLDLETGVADGLEGGSYRLGRSQRHRGRARCIHLEYREGFVSKPSSKPEAYVKIQDRKPM